MALLLRAQVALFSGYSTLPLVNHLRAIESAGRKESLKCARAKPAPSSLRVFLFAFFCTPFLLIGPLFVPLIGLLLALLVLWLGGMYLYVVGNARTTTVAVLGGVSCATCLALGSNMINTFGEAPLYIVFGMTTFMLIAAAVALAGWRFQRLS